MPDWKEFEAVSEPTSQVNWFEFDPAEFEVVPETSSTGAFLRSAVGGVLPSAAFAGAAGVTFPLLTGAAAETGPAAPFIGAGGSLIAGAGAARLTEAAQRKLLETVAPETAAKFEAQSRADVEAHPVASFLGSLASGLPSMRFEPGTVARGIKLLPQVLRGAGSTAEKQAVAAAATKLGAGAAGATLIPLALEQRLPTPEELASGVAFTALYGAPRFGGRPPLRSIDEVVSQEPPVPPPLPPRGLLTSGRRFFQAGEGGPIIDVESLPLEGEPGFSRGERSGPLADAIRAEEQKTIVPLRTGKPTPEGVQIIGGETPIERQLVLPPELKGGPIVPVERGTVKEPGSETLGKVSFGAEAPTLASQPLPKRTLEALEREKAAEVAISNSISEAESLAADNQLSDVKVKQLQVRLEDQVQRALAERQWTAGIREQVDPAGFTAIDELIARARFLGEGIARPVELLKATRGSVQPMESQTRGRVSFGAEAPTLAPQPLPERTLTAFESEQQGLAAGMVRIADALKTVNDKLDAIIKPKPEEPPPAVTEPAPPKPPTPAPGEAPPPAIEERTPNAIETRIEQQGSVGEREQATARGIPPEAGGGNRPVESPRGETAQELQAGNREVLLKPQAQEGQVTGATDVAKVEVEPSFERGKAVFLAAERALSDLSGVSTPDLQAAKAYGDMQIVLPPASRKILARVSSELKRREPISPAAAESPRRTPLPEATPPSPAQSAGENIPAKEPWQMTGQELKTLADKLVAERKGGGSVAAPFQAWQVTKRAYVDYAKLEGRGPIINAKRHADIVRRAVDRGDAVPPEVLADYPDLQKGAQHAQEVQGRQTPLTPEQPAKPMEAQKPLERLMIKPRTDGMVTLQTSDGTRIATFKTADEAGKAAVELGYEIAPGSEFKPSWMKRPADLISAEEAAQSAFEKLGAAERGAHDKSKRKGMTRQQLAKLAEFDKLVAAENEAKAKWRASRPKPPPASPSSQALGIVPQGSQALHEVIDKAIGKPQGVDTPVRTDTSTPLPDFQPTPKSREIFSQPFGFERIPVLGYLWGGLRRVKGAVNESVVTYFGERNVGRAAASALRQQYDWINKPFEIKDGQIVNIGARQNQSRYISDVFEALQDNPRAYQLNAEQQRAFAAMQALEADFKRLEIKYGIGKMQDSEGGPNVESDASPRRYFPRLVVERPQDRGTPLRRGAAVGSKAFFEKARLFDTEAEGWSKGWKYETDIARRIAFRAERLYKRIADKRLVSDPNLGGISRSELLSNLKTTYAEELASGAMTEARIEQIADSLESQGRVHQPAFFGKIFSADTAERLNKAFPNSTSKFRHGLATLNDALKALWLGFDLGVPFIQGQALLFHNPAVWGRSVANSIRAMGSREFFPEYVRRNLEPIREMAQLGSSVGRMEEMLAGTEQGQLLHRIPGVKQTVGRAIEPFARQFQTFLDTAKVELWKALRETTPKEEWSRTIQTLESVLMTSRMEPTGIGGTRALTERALLIAPSYYRGALNLIAAMGERGVPGRVARRALTSYMIGGSVLFYGIGKALGMTDEDLMRRFDPRRPDFMLWSLKVGDRTTEIGLGGIFKSLLKLAGNTVRTALEAPENFKSLSSDKNPFARWFRGHAGPATGLAWNAITGKDFLGEDWDITRAREAFLPMAVNTATQPGRFNPVETGSSFVGLTSFERSTPSGTEIRRMIGQFMRNSGNEAWKSLAEQRSKEPIASIYSPLRTALAQNDTKAAREEYQKLLKIRKASDIKEAMRPVTPSGSSKPFGPSAEVERKFRASLTPEQAKVYQSAIDERRKLWSRFLAIR